MSLAVGVAIALIATFGITAPAQAAPAPPPASMAAIGDSITQAMDTCGYRDCPQYSWSTGTSSSVGSHASRLRAAGASTLVVYNDAVSTAKSAGLAAQAQRAVTQKVGYVTVQIGANDACTRTVAEMTATTTFEANVNAALAQLSTGLPTATVFVASIPNIKRMWELSKGKSSARLIWGLAKICQSMLAYPTSTKAVDVTRRDVVQQRVNEYNAALERACAAYANCRFDGNTVANFAFTASHISTLDYFHPSVAGQAKLSEITWPKTPYGG
jgi:lysophospholipase L1-like esterase